MLAEVTEAGLDTRSPKQLVKRVIKTLLESDSVEEVYGSDEATGEQLTAQRAAIGLAMDLSLRDLMID